MRRIRFISRRRLSWVAVIAAGLFAALFVSTLWISPGFIAGDQDFLLWLWADRGRVEGGFSVDTSWGPYQPIRLTSIDKRSPAGFDLWFLIERSPYMYGNATSGRNRLVVPLWFPFIVFTALAVYLRRSERPEPWQCAACRYDLRGIDSDICPECGKQFESAS